jgi:hypothetical protein
MAENLMDGLLSEMNRVRDIIKVYEDQSINGAGSLAAAMMKSEIQQAEKAISEGDTIAMVLIYDILKENEL